MEKKLIEFLHKDKIRNAYVLKGLEKSVKNFEYKVTYTPSISYAAIWHEDQMVTLFGERKWCQETFERYYGQYDYYDMEENLLCELIENAPESVRKEYEFETHYLMQLYPTEESPDFGDVNSQTHKDNKTIRKAKTVKNTTRYQYLERDGRIIGSVLVEEISPGLFLISEVLVKKQFRKKGMAYAFVKRLLNNIFKDCKGGDCIFMLYVDKENTPAVKLYSKLNFEVVGEYHNLILMDINEY